MIKFPCICKHNFAVEDDMAGGLIQCPRCGRLNDIPTLDELRHIGEDGTYRIELNPLPKEPDRLNELRLAYSKDKTDDQGNEIDLRPSRQDIAKAGVVETPSGAEDAPARPAAPKYDPVTGELIRPMEIRPDPSLPDDPSKIPLARATLAYARPDLKKNIGAWRPLVSLLSPINLVVMFFVLIIHIGLAIAFVPIFAGFLIVIPLLFMFFCGLIAHYANVIEEIGYEERDELPRLFRHFSMMDDIFVPVWRIGIALFFCYGPAIAALIYVPESHRALATLAVAGLGTIFFPAALLTTVTSGSLDNMRPDRLVGIMGTIGIHYILILGLFVCAVAMYAVGIYATAINFVSLIVGKSIGFLSYGLVAYGFLFTGIYLMHAFSWYLGLIYRNHHNRFPWVNQRFIRTTPREKVAVHEAGNAVAKHRRDLRKIDQESARRFGY